MKRRKKSQGLIWTLYADVLLKLAKSDCALDCTPGQVNDALIVLDEVLKER